MTRTTLSTLRERSIDLATQFDHDASLERLLHTAEIIRQYLISKPTRCDELTFSVQTAIPIARGGDVRNLLLAAQKIFDFTDAAPSASDAIDFISRLKLKHPTKTLVNFNLYDFQKRTINYLDHSQALIIMQGRQMGVTTILAAYALYEAMTKSDQMILLCGPRYADGLETLERIRFMIDNIDLPRHDLQLVEYNKGSIMFSNGSRLLSRAWAVDVGRGLSITRLILDNAGCVPFSRLAEGWDALVGPCLMPAGRIVMAGSATVADGLFHHIWTYGKKPWRKLFLPWYEHPERNEDWAQRICAALPEERFAQEYGCSFKPSH
jgi:hypothetical protein